MTVTSSPDTAEVRVLIFALFGGDAELTRKILSSVGIPSVVCVGIDALCHAIEAGAGAVVLAEEALVPDAERRLTEVLAAQPAWSDLPIIVSTAERAARERRVVGTLGTVERTGNMSIVERPVRVHVMVSAVRNALRARTRQYAARALLDERSVLLAREQQARADAEAINRSKDEFLATVSHELRTPLNAILGWSRMLGTGRVPPSKSGRALEAIERNAVAQAQLIEDLLDVSRIVAGKVRLDVQEVDLQSVVDAAVESVRPAMDAKEIVFTRALAHDATRFMGDPNRLRQIVWNLLSNAIKFTPRRGHVDLTLSRVESHLELTVTDDGHGIEPAFLPRLFQRFQQEDGRTTRAHGGLGLGLAISRHLVELHGGTISASSGGVGSGAAFTVRLPVMAMRSARQGDPADTLFERRRNYDPPPELVGLSVLVLDDQADARELVAAVVSDTGAIPYEASSVPEALATLAERRPDLIVSDIGMPGEDGYSFIRRVRALPPELGGRTPAAALTAYARAEDKGKALGAGFDVHATKPVEPDEFVGLLTALARIGREIR